METNKAEDKERQGQQLPVMTSYYRREPLPTCLVCPHTGSSHRVTNITMIPGR